MYCMEQKKKSSNRLSSYIKLNAESDLALHLAIVALCLYGIIMIGSASMGTAVGNSMALALSIAKQFIFVCIGYVFMAKLSNFFSLKQLKGNGFSYVVIWTMVMMIVCLAFPAVKGAKAWLRIPLPGFEITVQPAEFAKIIVILLVALHLGDRKYKEEETCMYILKKPLVLCGILLGITVVLQKDFGTMAIQFLLFCIVVLIPKNPKLKKFQTGLRICFYSVVAISCLILNPYGEKIISGLPLKTYQKNRFYAAIDPFKDVYGTGYQVIAGLIAMSEGGLKGKGIGNSTRKYMNFPEANNDFILAIIIEECGFIGFLFLLALYGFIIYRLFYYARRIKSEPARIILVGTAMYFFLHIFLNVGGVTGLIPLTGVPLPLVSAGGSSAMSFMASIGICQAIIGAYKRKEIQ